ncbi:hypothetical protein CEXT_654781 [Caerostris extrusa]|uniref:Uncharacterized protein n=1 Tax=Caerostris extrusa TaxID=172846 RepID=A0AAV4V9R0_CAEEX|nr:hypothetical protein CEXT_654781 [Caerostris extrusa]
MHINAIFLFTMEKRRGLNQIREENRERRKEKIKDPVSPRVWEKGGSKFRDFVRHSHLLLASLLTSRFPPPPLHNYGGGQRGGERGDDDDTAVVLNPARFWGRLVLAEN